MSAYRGKMLSSFDLPVNVISKLLEVGIIYDKHLFMLNEQQISKECGLSLEECQELMKVTSSSNSDFHHYLQSKSLLQMLEDESDDVTHIVTFCKDLDDLLGGGIPLGTLTEIAGTPGVGKTQICIQACVSVQLPESVGGVSGEALFIDTEQSFTLERLKEIATYAVHHIQMIGSTQTDVQQFTVQSICKQVHFIRCTSCVEVVAVIGKIPSILQKNPKIRLIVFDSIALHFRHNFPDSRARTNFLCKATQDLLQLAAKHKMAVIMTNHMTTRIRSDESSYLVPTLGENWGHGAGIRVVLHWMDSFRVATLTKSPHTNDVSASFQVTVAGIRDVDKQQLEEEQSKDPLKYSASKKSKISFS